MAPNGVLSYGGGRQTVAICVLILQGKLPHPDKIVMADTGRENPMTWDYLNDVSGPAMNAAGLQIEVIRPDHEPDLYNSAGSLLLPVFTGESKLRPFCSGMWKRDVCDRYLSQKYGIRGGVRWIGFSADEKRRLKVDPIRHNWQIRYPLAELGITSEGCRELIEAFGWPQPHRSACWMCPNKTDGEWQYIQNNYPELWKKVVAIDAETREIDVENGREGVYLHRSRKPISEALNQRTPDDEDGRCETGMCFV